MQFAGLADSGGPVRSSPTRPKILFVLAADEAFEIDAPDNVPRAHEVQGRKRDGNRRGPPLFGDSCFRCPHAIPPWITVSQTRLGTQFLGDESVTLSAKWIDLVNVRVPPIMGGVYDDFKVIIQFLGDIPPQFCSNDLLGFGVTAGDADIDLMLGVNDPNFGLFCWW